MPLLEADSLTAYGLDLSFRLLFMSLLSGLHGEGVDSESESESESV